MMIFVIININHCHYYHNNYYYYVHLLLCVLFPPHILQFSNHLPGGLIPYDGVPTEKEVSVDLSLTVIFSVLATAGIAFAVVCLVFNFIFRDKK